MHHCEYVVQSPASTGRVLVALMRILEGQSFACLRGCFAYASRPGAVLLVDALEQSLQRWRTMKKHWLVSFDFGFTSPGALEYLASLPSSEVRVPNGLELLKAKLMPQETFHPKSLMLSSQRHRRGFVLSGSANMTENGLCLGHEQATISLVRAPARKTDIPVLKSLEGAERDIGLVFESAVPLTDSLLTRYATARKKYKRELPRRRPSGLDLVPLQSHGNVEGSVARLAVMAEARFFWVDVDYVVPNRGARLPGNQIDLKRGCRVFFGFEGTKVERNYIFGDTTILAGDNEFRRGMRYGNNQMDKLNLPAPEEIGLKEYAGLTLLFERTSDGRFRMSAKKQEDADKWRRASDEQRTAYQLTSGRRFGVFS